MQVGIETIHKIIDIQKIDRSRSNQIVDFRNKNGYEVIEEISRMIYEEDSDMGVFFPHENVFRLSFNIALELKTKLQLEKFIPEIFNIPTSVTFMRHEIFDKDLLNKGMQGYYKILVDVDYSSII